MIEIAWGIRVEDERVVGVDQVESGLACGCVCPECRQPLVAAKGDINQHHFRHQADVAHGCGGGQETALHTLAKTMVAEASSITLPDGIRDILSTELEVRLDDIRPDVLLHTPVGDVAVELVVNHWSGKEKIAKFQAIGLLAVEIDLSGYRGVVMSAGDLREIVLTHARRYWLKPTPPPAPKRELKDTPWQPSYPAPRSYKTSQSEMPLSISRPNDTLSDAWSNGFQARENHETKDSNPYREGFDRHSEWIKGWNSAVHVAQP